MAALTAQEQVRLDEIGRIINEGRPKKNLVLNLRMKNALAKAIRAKGSIFITSNPSRQKTLLPQLLQYIKLASGCRVGNQEIAGLVNKLITDAEDKTELLNAIVYRKRYETPEIVPQQFANQFQHLLPEKFNQNVNVYFLLDQMVGYVFEDGTTWIQGDMLKDVVER